MEWDAKGHIVNTIAMLNIEFKGESLALAVSQNPKTKYFRLPETHMAIFPKGIREELLQPDKSQNNLPMILASETLLKCIQNQHADNQKIILALPIANFLHENNIKPLFKDNFPKYVLDAEICI